MKNDYIQQIGHPPRVGSVRIELTNAVGTRKPGLLLLAMCIAMIGLAEIYACAQEWLVVHSYGDNPARENACQPLATIQQSSHRILTRIRMVWRRLTMPNKSSV